MIAPTTRRKFMKFIKQGDFIKRGDFKLASGESTDVYTDIRSVALSPVGQRLTGEILFEAIRTHNEVYQVGGMATGSIPLICSVAKYYNGFYVRKEAKDYGLQRLIEGPFTPDAPTIILEDVVSSGSTVEFLLKILDEFQTPISAIIALIDRTKKPVKFGKIPYEPIFSLDELL